MLIEHPFGRAELLRLVRGPSWVIVCGLSLMLLGGCSSAPSASLLPRVSSARIAVSASGPNDVGAELGGTYR
jgi:hypothetical protein